MQRRRGVTDERGARRTAIPPPLGSSVTKPDAEGGCTRRGASETTVKKVLGNLRTRQPPGVIRESRVDDVLGQVYDRQLQAR